MVGTLGKPIQEKDLRTVRIVFISLLMDLVAFTMILPLFPALLDHYKQLDEGYGFYSKISNSIRAVSMFIDAPDKESSVLFGGFLGSMYSFLQFIGSPIIGSLSDVYGRKPLMILCLSGITLSYLLWALSESFVSFIFARFVGGISKGNISLSMAILSDVTSSASRGQAMALVGIAFSVGFVLGPVIGALFAKFSSGHRGGQWYSLPASCAFALSVIALLYFSMNFEETLPKESRMKSLTLGVSNAMSFLNPVDLFQFNRVLNLTGSELQKLRVLGRSYFLYLFIYSGLEFTLTFLTHYSFGFTRMQQGWMFLGIGLTMAIIQGVWIRKVPPDETKSVTELGLWLTIPAFICIAVARGLALLYFGVFLFAVSTAMVVTCMMTLVTRIGPENQKGSITGIFRSLGALARACGPIVASVAFWSLGSTATYLIGAASLALPLLILRNMYLNDSSTMEMRYSSFNIHNAPKKCSS